MDNNAHAAGRIVYGDPLSDCAVLDILPPEFRALVHEFPIKLSAKALADTLRARLEQDAARAAPYTLAEAKRYAAYELAEFAKKHLTEHGYVLPHVAAFATRLTYGDRRPEARRRPKHSRVTKP